MDKLKDYLDNEQLRLEKMAEEYRKDANRNISELSKHLILASTIFIALSSSILGINGISKTLSICGKWALIEGLVFMVLSIILGLIQYLVDYLFFKKQLKNKEDTIDLIYNNKFKSTDEYLDYSDKESKKLKSESSNIPIIFQSIFIVSGIVVFIFVIYSLVF